MLWSSWLYQEIKKKWGKSTFPATKNFQKFSFHSDRIDDDGSTGQFLNIQTASMCLM